MANPSETQPKLLYFEEHNTEQPESIIFLHGGFGSHVEWKSVISEESLASKHLILVDLPGHSASRDIEFPSLEAAAEEVAQVIRQRAHGGKAHVVGFSLGGFVALVLTRRCPDVVLSTFASGAYPYRGFFKWVMARPRVHAILNSVENIPGFTEWSLRMQGIDGKEWLEETKKNQSWDSKAAKKDLADYSMDDVRAVADSGVRTCVVAGGKMDQVDAYKEMSVALREGGKKKGIMNEAVVVRDAYHPWHLQIPDLFAGGVKAWVDNEELPSAFERL